VHLRRALLLFALVLGLTALAASIAPAPRSDQPAVRPPPPATTPGAREQSTVAFSSPVPGPRPPQRRVAAGAHVIVTVTAGGPGQASIPLLGRTASMTVDSPARFDLLAPPPGSYPVVFTSAAGEPTRVGTLVSR
jgi:hypothetical protein